MEKGSLTFTSTVPYYFSAIIIFISVAVAIFCLPFLSHKSKTNCHLTSNNSSSKNSNNNNHVTDNSNPPKMR